MALSSTPFRDCKLKESGWVPFRVSSIFFLPLKWMLLPASNFSDIIILCHFSPSNLSRLRISYRGLHKGPEQCFGVPIVSCLMEECNGEHKEKDESFSTDCQQEAVNDLKLPGRSLVVNFTCDACGVRSQRLINRLAYERGLVYVQCAGCSQYHKLVDNLGLVIEYNLQEGIDSDANMDQV